MRYLEYHAVFPDQNGKLKKLCDHGSLEPFGHLSIAEILILRPSNLENVLEGIYNTLHQPSPKRHIPFLSDVYSPSLASISSPVW